MENNSKGKPFKEKDTEKNMSGLNQNDSVGHLDNNSRMAWKPKSSCTIQADIGAYKKSYGSVPVLKTSQKVTSLAVIEDTRKGASHLIGAAYHKQEENMKNKSNLKTLL